MNPSGEKIPPTKDKEDDEGSNQQQLQTNDHETVRKFTNRFKSNLDHHDFVFAELASCYSH